MCCSVAIPAQPRPTYLQGIVKWQGVGTVDPIPLIGTLAKFSLVQTGSGPKLVSWLGHRFNLWLGSTVRGLLCPVWQITALLTGTMYVFVADKAIREMNRKEKNIVRGYLNAVKYASQLESRVRVMFVGDTASGKEQNDLLGVDGGFKLPLAFFFSIGNVWCVLNGHLKTCHKMCIPYSALFSRH